MFKKATRTLETIPVVRPYTTDALLEDARETVETARTLIAEATALADEAANLARQNAIAAEESAVRLLAKAQSEHEKSDSAFDYRDALPVF